MARRLRGERPGSFRIGRCRCCGACCRDMALTDEGKKIATVEEFEQFVRENPRYAVFQPKTVTESGILVFSCTKIDGENRCTIYPERPDICVEYPQAALLSCGADVKEGCGFTLVPPEDFEDILKRLGEGK
ncbi:MAG: YkgJ family cysteine cluster protein [Candidatus Eremiobacteraeota bacterium]|nr:YkgJ family cysteine cluster protein [Candidatus Eremiobacteraeota bacterium]